MIQKYFIIGSNSFSGSNFVDFLLKQGHLVAGISRSDEPHRVFLPYRWSIEDNGFRFYKYDLNTNLEEIIALVKTEKPSVIVNFAAQSMVAESWRNPDHWFMTNIISTVRFHERLRHYDFLDKYIHVTTPEVYGSTHGSIDENAVFNPSTPYAVSRAAADMSLKTFFDAYKFPVVFTRASNVYGAGQQLYRITPRTVLFIRLGKKIQLHGGGKSSRSFIHIRDVCDATQRIALNGLVGETYHISTERVVTIRELVEIICSRMDVAFEDCVEVVGERPGKDAAYLLDSGKLRKKLRWQDEISLEDGIDEVIKWVDDNLDILSKQELNYIHKP